MQFALVKIDVAAVELQMSPDRIEQLADGGLPGESGLLWVFNLSSNPKGKMRSLRFWIRELRARNTAEQKVITRMELDQVLSEILSPQREVFRGTELDHLFQLRRPSRKDMDAEMSATNSRRVKVYSRNALVSFLSRRWLGQMGMQNSTIPEPLYFAAGQSAATMSLHSGQTGLKRLKEGHSAQIRRKVEPSKN